MNQDNPSKTTTAVSKKYTGFTAEERAAMKTRIKEEKAAATQAEEENAVLEAIAAMSEPDRAMAERLHEIIKANAPALSPRLWYGMPAYAKENGKILCFFQSAQRFKTRYATLGFMHEANLDEGAMWPVEFAVTELTPAVEARIAALVKQAVS